MATASTDPVILRGTANPALADGVARALGVETTPCETERFPDGEFSVTLKESIRGRDVFVVQPTSPPVNDHLIELLVFADACRRASAARITAVVPYFGYARADRRDCRREPITASLVADLMECAGFDHVITVDLHAAQIEGFFRIPVDSLSAVELLCDALVWARARPDHVVVSPDAGRVKMATEYADRLDLPLCVLHKRRLSGGVTEVMHVVGDVRGRTCILIDDLIATGGTLIESMGALREAGAVDAIVVATHGLFVAGAIEKLQAAQVRELVTTDSVAINAQPVLRVVSIAPLLAAAISRDLSRHSACD
jgi:ribose-phosphate pyrophosphokinase